MVNVEEQLRLIREGAKHLQYTQSINDLHTRKIQVQIIKIKEHLLQI